MGFVASQPEFSLAVPKGGTKAGGAEPADDLATRFMTAADRAWHEKTGFPAFCYSPTARGYFATGGAKAAESFDAVETPARLARAQELARQKGCTANQIAPARAARAEISGGADRGAVERGASAGCAGGGG